MSTTTSGTKRKLEETDIESKDETPRKLIKTEKEEAVDPGAGQTEQPAPIATTTVNAEKQELSEDEPTLKLETANDDNTNVVEEKKDKEEKSGSKAMLKIRIPIATKTLDPANQQKLQAQIEWYFGDSNLSMDGHIQYESKKNNGFFPLKNLVHFNAVISLTDDIEAVRAIIRSSSKLQLNEAETGVQRHPSFPAPPTKEDILSRTIFAKGFHPTMTMQDLRTFWQKQMAADKTADSVLAVRTIKETLTVGIAEENKPKRVNRFMGQCLVEFDTVELAQKLSKMTFNCHHRLICCAIHASYANSDIEWKIKRQYHPFVSQTLLAVKNVPIHSTHCDVKHWAETALFVHKNHGTNRVAFVYKERNKCTALMRLTANSQVSECLKLLRSRALMGSHPMVRVLDDEQAQQLWNKVAQIDYHQNEDVDMVVTPKPPKPSNHHRDHQHHNHNNNDNKNSNSSLKQEENHDQKAKENDADNCKETTVNEMESKTEKTEQPEKLPTDAS